MSSYVAWKGWCEDDFGTAGKDHSRYFERELDLCGIKNIRGCKVIELGFGNGQFAAWVAKQGGEWVGYEIDAMLLSRAQKQGYRALHPSAGLVSAWGPGGADLIVAFDVLEHLSRTELQTVLTEAQHSLRPGAHFLFRVPSGDSPFSGGLYRGDLTHQMHLGSSAIRQLIANTDFEAIQVRGACLPVTGLGFTVAVRRLFVVAFRAAVFFALRNWIIGNSGAVMAPNMVVLLRRRGVATTRTSPSEGSHPTSI